MTKYEKMTIEEFARATDLQAHLVASIDGFTKKRLEMLEGLQRGRVTIDLVFDAESGRYGWEKHVEPVYLTPVSVTNDGEWSSSLPEIKVEEAKPIGTVEINAGVEAKPRKRKTE